MFAGHLLTFQVFFFCLAAVLGAPTVSLPYGTFRGFNEGNLTKFLGVPFATAPRFETPQPPKRLYGIQNATAFAPACPQQALSTGPIVRFPFNQSISLLIEPKGLNLDIYKPSTAHPGSKLPVLLLAEGCVHNITIHPGGFELGDSSTTDFAPLLGRSIETGEPVIVVAPNYRVTAFGFLPGKEVNAAGVSNLGLRDQIFALEWVKRHVDAFGGDPNRVVIGGVSAGSVSSATLLLNNKQNSNALFRGVFLESGAQIPAPLDDGQATYDALVAATNCTLAADTLNCLRRVPFEALMAAADQTPDIFSYKSLQLVWRPYVDGDVLQRAPLTSLAERLFAQWRCVPIMAGSCDDEGTCVCFTSCSSRDVGLMTGLYSLFSFSTYFPVASPDQIATEIGRLYPDDPTQGSPFGTGTADQLAQYKRLAAFQGDYLFIGQRRFLLQHASSRQNTWSWCNKYGKDASPLGATHTTDGPIWFTSNMTGVGSVGIDAFRELPTSHRLALHLERSRNDGAQTVNFINTLNPNTPAESASASARLPIFWPQWNGNSTSLLTFGATGGTNFTADDFRAEAIEFLNGLILAESERKKWGRREGFREATPDYHPPPSQLARFRFPLGPDPALSASASGLTTRSRGRTTALCPRLWFTLRPVVLPLPPVPVPVPVPDADAPAPPTWPPLTLLINGRAGMCCRNDAGMPSAFHTPGGGGGGGGGAGGCARVGGR
ncbi:Alpha/Beta hydrolase protein [Mycena filopes]|nr:Alpha/Beta hydrolase protein [Mycena filopes]